MRGSDLIFSGPNGVVEVLILFDIIMKAGFMLATTGTNERAWVWTMTMHVAAVALTLK